MNDIFRLAFLPVDSDPDTEDFESAGASAHRSLAEAVKGAVRGTDGELVPFILSRGVVFHPHHIRALVAALDAHEA